VASEVPVPKRVHVDFTDSSDCDESSTVNTPRWVTMMSEEYSTFARIFQKDAWSILMQIKVSVQSTI
jgi:hypothetical protein